MTSYMLCSSYRSVGRSAPLAYLQAYPTYRRQQRRPQVPQTPVPVGHLGPSGIPVQHAPVTALGQAMLPRHPVLQAPAALLAHMSHGQPAPVGYAMPPRHPPAQASLTYLAVATPAMLQPLLHLSLHHAVRSRPFLVVIPGLLHKGRMPDMQLLADIAASD